MRATRFAIPRHALLRTVPATHVTQSAVVSRRNCGLARSGASSSASLAAQQTSSLSLWNGSDEFTVLDDRKDAPPLPLPPVDRPVRVVIVRHGQSTWNAEGRIQGSTDLSVLTAKGVKQAEKTQDMLSAMRFAAVLHSPLARARQTAEVVLQAHQPGSACPAPAPAPTTLPSLREIDLYSFQGLLKHEGKALYGKQYGSWQKAPEAFEIDGHPPVRELWHRASLVWRQVLATAASLPATPAPSSPSAPSSCDPPTLLVVAHNAINQALVGTALGLPPSYFRRLPQNNAALSVLDLRPGDGGGAPEVALSCLNQSPDNPFKNPDKVVANVALLSPPPPGPGGERAVAALAETLSKIRISHVLATPCASPELIEGLLSRQAQAGPGSGPGPAGPAPDSTPVTWASASSLSGPSLSSADDSSLSETEAEAEPAPRSAAAGAEGAGGGLEPLAVAVDVGPTAGPTAAAQLWGAAVALAAEPDRRAGTPHGNILVVLDEAQHVGAIWAALGLGLGPDGPADPARARLVASAGGLSVVEFAADPRTAPAFVRCINNTAHLE
ncbi:hypothetical protein HYH03_013902 [Edaphochlamys debaryana]|uniref:Phosphoglycerate mutase n=1 Tax=Edaphochlamys debaryana TaxID=47281 RepID=A0A836BSH0_9CHLO|nr:hypothetical protein HYH03_013902 [Edaphochlamys debaryana]|eukprot:KAG2487481.1 hypothetical protein HYH03_013902 [Edaphochlamys debaryana]